MSECEQFPEGSNKRAICEGTADLPLSKINAYRKKWNLEPFEGEAKSERVIHSGPKVVHKGERPVAPRKKACAKCKTPQKEKSSIGTRMHEIIKRETGAGTPCSDCKRAITALNLQTPDEVKANQAAIVSDIASRAETKAPKLWQRIAAKADRLLGTGQVEAKIQRWLTEAIETGAEVPKTRSGKIPSPGVLWKERNPGSVVDSEVPLVVGVVTCSSRLGTLLLETLHSLTAAGFFVHRLFIDGDGECDFGIPVTQHIPSVGPFGNTLLALQELFFRYRNASKYVLFQDDVTATKGLADYLRSQELAPGAWWNLLSHPSNESLVASGNGWYKANQNGHGAAGLVFGSEAMNTLLTSPLTTQWVRTNKPYPTQVDFAIASVLRRSGFTELCHQPGLIQHRGVKSTLRLKDWPAELSKSFPGEEKDARDYLEVNNG